jgi:hypothetical protein
VPREAITFQVDQEIHSIFRSHIGAAAAFDDDDGGVVMVPVA